MIFIVATIIAYATKKDRTVSAPHSLEAWITQEAAIVERMEAGPGPGLATPAQIAGKSGLEVMQAMLNGEIPFAAIAKTLDFSLIEVAPGRAVFQGTPLARHLNPLGTIHGGWVATLLDSALGCTIHTMMPPGRGYTTAELGVNYVKGLTPKVQRVRAEGKVIHCGRQLATAEARLFSADGTLFAHATTTCLVFEMPTR
ncbi:MAG: PaaI family thioesterase [Variovorax sp.]|nr:MAG: PaaI family thioesterase [Variovorax sp.]